MNGAMPSVLCPRCSLPVPLHPGQGLGQEWGEEGQEEEEKGAEGSCQALCQELDYEQEKSQLVLS